jgi:hypothetical protein
MLPPHVPLGGKGQGDRHIGLRNSRRLDAVVLTSGARPIARDGVVSVKVVGFTMAQTPVTPQGDPGGRDSLPSSPGPVPAAVAC